MKTVLLYANDDNGFECRFQAALDMARAFDAHLNCLQVTPFDAFIMGDPFGGVYVMPTILEQVRSVEEAHRNRIEERLKAEGMSWDWKRCDGSPALLVTRCSALSDLVVLSLATEGAGYDGPLSLVDDVILEVRAPVLAVPAGNRSIDCLGNAVVAWDGSSESAHSLRLSLAMLGKAAAVHVVTVGEDEGEFSATEACAYLARHGVASQLHSWPREGRSTAQALLDSAVVLRGSHLVMGAYGHSRMREAVLGGATRELLRTSPLPLLLGH